MALQKHIWRCSCCSVDLQPYLDLKRWRPGQGQAESLLGKEGKAALPMSVALGGVSPSFQLVLKWRGRDVWWQRGRRGGDSGDWNNN